MRLIDADDLISQAREWQKDKDRFAQDVSEHCIIILDHAKTVDAIPIEWIKEYIELQESYDTEVGDIFGIGVREMLRYCAERKEHETD